jgi:hypothetical protein
MYKGHHKGCPFLLVLKSMCFIFYYYYISELTFYFIFNM